MIELEEKTISGLLPWFGSKRTMAPLIVAELGPHHTYFEPFCGSMAVLLAKPTTRMETVNDLHGDLINVARVIQDRASAMAFYRQCRRMLMVEDLHREAAARWKSRRLEIAPASPDVDRAIDFFFSSWVGRNGVTGTQSFNQGFAARYTPGGGHGATRWSNARRSIPGWRGRLQGVTILNRCAFDLIDKLEDAEGMAMCVDGPYVIKNAKYVHDFPTIEEELSNPKKKGHIALAKALHRFKVARIVVCYYDHPEVRKLYQDWTIVEHTQSKPLVSGNGRIKGTTEAPEILLINGPSYARPAQGSMF